MNDTPNPITAPADKLLTIAQLATRLQCHRATVHRYAKAGHLPSVRVGRLVRFRESDLQRLMGKRA